MTNITQILSHHFSQRKQKILLYLPELKSSKSIDNLFICNTLNQCKKWLTTYLFDLVIFDYEKSSAKETFALFANRSNPLLTLCCSSHDSFEDVLFAYQQSIDLFLPRQSLQLPYFRCALELLLQGYNRIIISKNPQIQRQYELLFFYARQIKSDVLITGENGTGKGIIANAIHVLSDKKGEIVTQNCAGIPDTLFESEMFGYAPGAFTGASQKGKVGVIEKADKGILFLDEIGDLPLNQQAKLLRAIQRKTILRVGATKETKVDVRFLFATNKNLEQEVLQGNFREDFYYRLKGAEIQIPPLRNTTEDIEMMTAIFVNRFIKEQFHKKQIPNLQLDRDSFRNILNYQFPGNMRELQKMVYQALIHMLIRGDNLLTFSEDEQKPTSHQEKETNVETFWQIISLLEQRKIKYGGLVDSMKKPVIDHLRTKYNDARKEIADILGFQDRQSLANEIYRLNKSDALPKRQK